MQKIYKIWKDMKSTFLIKLKIWADIIITCNVVKINMTLLSLKCMDKLVIKLKVIKYNEDIFCYLSFYILNLGF